MTAVLEIKDFFNFWTRIHDSVLHLVSLLEDKDLSFSFDTRLASVGYTFLHIANAINGWLEEVLKDGIENPEKLDLDYLTTDQLRERLTWSFNRLDQFLKKCTLEDWSKHYIGIDEEGPYDFTLEWVLWHLVEHEIHHRTQLRLQLRSLNKKIDDKIFWEATTHDRW